MKKWIFLWMGAAMLITLGLVLAPWGTVSDAVADNDSSEETEELTTRFSQTEESEKEEEQPVMEQLYQAQNKENVKAMWLSQFDMSSVYSVDGKQRPEPDYRILLEQILDRVAETGINTVIVQVRPYMDSMYPSEYYPMSKYAVGAYGADADYDAFAILLKEAHKRGLSVHAWINPLRGMLTEEILQIDGRYPVRQMYEDGEKRGRVLVEHGGRWYLNPAYEEARVLIVNGACEILTKYEVDGLHMDDYFYPSGCTESFDERAYVDYLKNVERISLQAFRRMQVNTLVRELYAMVKKTNDTVLFGISPGGNMLTNYNHLGADVYTWCAEEGYIDYICPQVYWGMEHETYDFVSVCKTFDDMIKVESVKLVIGMTLGKAKSGYDQYAGSGQWEWRDHKDILYRCLQHTATLKHCVGVSYFCYQYFYDPLTGRSTTETENERNLFIPLLKKMRWNTTKS